MRSCPDDRSFRGCQANYTFFATRRAGVHASSAGWPYKDRANPASPWTSISPCWPVLALKDPFIDALLAAYPARIAEAGEFAHRNRVLLLRTMDGVGIDVSFGALPFEERVASRATLFAFGPGLDIRTCWAEDRIVLKLFASRPLDALARDLRSLTATNSLRPK